MSLLLQLTVKTCFDCDARAEVDLVGDERANGAEGVKALGARPLAVGLLQVAGGDVIDDGVAADLGRDGLVGADLRGATADDDS